MLPDLDGFEVCRRMRTDGDRTAVIFLTAHDATEDKVRGLTLGGDDYVTKPFSLEEVVARVRVILRRAGIDPAANSRLEFADLEMDEDAYRVWRAGRARRAVADRVQAAALLPAEPRSGAVARRRSSITSGSTTSVAAPTWSRPTCPTCARSSTGSGPPLIQTVRGVGYALRKP